MPEKDGDEGKSTKSVVNKKQKQMMGEEGDDIARDMGRVRPSKDKKDATTMPVSKEMKKTQKVNKGPSALDIVKKKYKGQIMNVGKKKVKEELDLTQVAEAFGGYIVESERVIIKKKGEPGTIKGGKTIIAPRKGQEKAESDLITNLQLTGRLKIPTTKKKRTTSSLTRNMATDKEIADAEKEFKAGGGGNKPPQEIRDPKTGETIVKGYTTPTEQERIDKETKSKPEYQQAKTGAQQGVANIGTFSSDTRTQAEFEKDEAERARKRSTGKGDGRRAGRTPEERRTKKVTYQTFANKPEVTGGQDRATDTRFSVDFPKPEKETKPETKKRVRRVKPKKDKVITQQEPQKTKAEPQTQTQMGDGEPPKPPKVTTSAGASSGGGKEPSLVSKVAKFSKANPATALLSFDALRKLIPSRSPFGVVGGRAGLRSAAR